MDPCLPIRQHFAGVSAEFAVGIPTAAAAIGFRYDPVFRYDTEFVLWYRPASGGASDSNCSIRFRWFAADDRPLTSDSDPEPLDLAAGGHWRPLRVEVPVQPRDCEGLRFEARVADAAHVYPISRGRLRIDTTVEHHPMVPSEKPEPAHGLAPGITAVVTSCGRQDLLERTLDSFFEVNSFPIARIIVVEDGPPQRNFALAEKYRNQAIQWLATGKRMGQIVAIDYAYSFVDSEFIFHFEDDWEFWRDGFIRSSIPLLQSLPNCLQVYVRATDDINGHPLAPELCRVGGQLYRRVEFGYINAWHGFSFNPGLRRTVDYRRLGRYGRQVRHDRDRPGRAEARLSRIYRDCGFYAVILAEHEGTGYVRHIGEGRRVE